MRKTVNRKAAFVAMMPAIMIPVQRMLQTHQVPDPIIGLFVGVMIGIMILLLIFAMRDRSPNL